MSVGIVYKVEVSVDVKNASCARRRSKSHLPKLVVHLCALVLLRNAVQSDDNPSDKLTSGN